MKYILTVVILIFFYCTPALIKPKIVPDLTLRNIPVPSEFQNAGAVVLLDEGRMEIHLNQKMNFSEYTRFRAVKILDKDGFLYANVLIPFSGDSKVHFDFAYTISPSGKVTWLKPSDIYEIPLYPRFVFYSDQKAKIFTFPDVVPGSIVVYKYRITYSFLTASSGWVFQEKIPVLDSKFTIDYPSGLKLHYKEYYLENKPQKIINPPGFRNVITWHETHIKPLKIEVNMPPAKMNYRRISFTPLGFHSWEDVSQWYSKLFFPMVKLHTRSDSILKQIRQENGRHLPEKLYYWIQKNIRYMAVEIGVGRFQPHPAEEVLEKKYGDCKDMVVCATALGKQMGIHLVPILIPFRTYAWVDSENVTPAIFNHLIAMCMDNNGKPVYMDFTSKTTPFGEIPWYLQGQTGLVIDDTDSPRLVTLPVSVPEENLLLDSAIVELKKNSIAVKGCLIFTGSAGDDLNSQMYRRSAEEKKIFCENLVLNDWKSLEIESLSFRENMDSLCIQYQGRIPIVQKNGEQYILFNPGDELYFKMNQVFVDSVRNWDIIFKYRYKNRIVRTILLQEGWNAIISREHFSGTSPFGKLNYQLETNEKNLRYIIEQINDRILVKKDEYKAFRKFLKAFTTLNQQYILLHRSKHARFKKKSQN
jgi:hypothetical protein